MKVTKGTLYNVRVQKVIEKGVIVIMPDNTTEFIHVSRLSDKYISSPEAIAAPDMEWEVAAIYNERLQKVELSHRMSDIIKLKQSDSESLLKAKKSSSRKQPYKVDPKETFIPKQHAPKSFDAMIADANKVLADKRKAVEHDMKRRPRRK